MDKTIDTIQESVEGSHCVPSPPLSLKQCFGPADLWSMLEFSVADVHRKEFVDTPIPAPQVLDGNPVARSCDLHASREGGLSMNLWDCTAGLFRWHFASDELVEILEGEVCVTAADGTQRVLRPGDTAHFPAGTSFVWEVSEYVKKLAIHRSAQTVPDRALMKATRALARRRSAFGARPLQSRRALRSKARTVIRGL